MTFYFEGSDCNRVILNGTFCWELAPHDFPVVGLHIISIAHLHLFVLGGSV